MQQKRVPLWSCVIPYVWVALALIGCTSREGSEQARLQMASPRDFGYFIGDVIHQTLEVNTQGSRDIDPASLPPTGALNDWLTVVGSHIDTANDSDESRTRVVVDYQIFKGVRAPEQVALPPLTLRLSGTHLQELTSPPFNVHLNPVIPQELQDEDVVVRDPMPPLPINASTAKQGLSLSILGLILSLCLLGLRIWLLNRQTRPFGACESEFRSAIAAGDLDALKGGLRLIHRALDQTLGETLFRGQLPTFLKHHPRFEPLSARLNDFFVLSQQVFFAQEPQIDNIKDKTGKLRTLFDQCRKVEKQAP